MLFRSIKLARKYRKTVIVSSHNFQKTPGSSILEKTLKASLKKGADIVKIAAKANSLSDVKRLMEFTAKHRKQNIITMSLGDVGSISRLIFPGAGSLLTYGYLTKPFGPGQLPVDVLCKLLRIYYPGYR